MCYVSAVMHCGNRMAIITHLQRASRRVSDLPGFPQLPHPTGRQTAASCMCREPSHWPGQEETRVTSFHRPAFHKNYSRTSRLKPGQFGYEPREETGRGNISPRPREWRRCKAQGKLDPYHDVTRVRRCAAEYLCELIGQESDLRYNNSQ
jgi:hypothetical protein